MYPLATYEARLFLCLSEESDGDPRIPRILEKYRDRGFQMVHQWAAKDFVSLVKSRPRLFPNRARSMDDQYTWRIPLPMEGVIPPPACNPHSEPLSVDPCFCTFWRLQLANPTTTGELFLRPRLRYFPVSMRNFHHTYILSFGYVGEEVRKEMSRCAAHLQSPERRDVW